MQRTSEAVMAATTRAKAAEAPNVWPKQETKPCEKNGVRVLMGFCSIFACDGCLEDCVRRLILVRSQKWISD